MKLARTQYAEMFGPMVGDQVRLADTELFIEIERDLIGCNLGTEQQTQGHADNELV